MANTVVINGDKRKFTLSPDLKLYALIDAGFVKSVKGNFTYEHPLYNDSPYNAPTKLKMTINKELSHLTMVVTDRSGLQKVNIFKNKQLASTVDLLNYILKDLEERKILQQVKD
ncbi:DUF1831 domain-containing protein [Lactobacillus ultunensis]|uniref:Amino acid metabolism n=1 Tax=Lactobacillus ultunensis DSM 16047 TaxID=525365 RepID=C2EMH7_9LACO|nr:DUF1831 domain-containing protein [Lactobacillus ultunensis]EEJ72186.1 hypothetical protein HMPREF0548_0873 [Lactobacillus ultunensis DSM 16047]KRL82966.1 hypothetical protein FC57_GL000724 [Lactobacillus ultunensis DSM 16047]QQP27873.1 DUF1831 domain-containing protein [Lactobacillus ultunensis]